MSRVGDVCGSIVFDQQCNRVFVLTAFRRTRDYVYRISRAPLTVVEHNTARTQAQAMLVILRPLVASTHITKRNTVCRQLNFPNREHAGVSRAHRKSDARLFSARCKSVSRGSHVDSLNVNPNFGAVTYRGLAHQESRYRERPESSAREDRLPRALLSVHFVRDRRPAEIARTLRDLPTLYPS